jgi:predicted HicB family RNase H-like nuclease
MEEEPMKKTKLPKTDSVAELAKFWDSHDLTDFEDELEEVTEPIFASSGAIRVHLPPRDAAAVKKLAQAEGISQEELVRGWVRQHVARWNGRGAKKRPGASKARK